MEEKGRVNVRLTPETHKFYKEESKKQGYTMHGMLVQALNTYKEVYEREKRKKGE